MTGPRESVVPGETGILVPPDDPPALAESLGWLLEDSATCERMGAAGRRCSAKELFDLERNLAALDAECERLVAARP